MQSKFRFSLVRLSTAICLMPSWFIVDKRLYDKLNEIRGTFLFILNNPSSVLDQLALHSTFIKVVVKTSLSFAIVLHNTCSFKELIRYVFKVLSGATVFEEKPSENYVSVEPGSEKTNLYKEYVEFIITRAVQDKSTDFVPLSVSLAFKGEQIDIKPIAFYLPQFHTFPLNDEWYGKGFTEWTNVTKAIPQYVGHYQPQLPIDMGYYNLNDMAVMSRQVELAKIYGIHGFCFHYYWFSGTRLMEKPIFNWLENKEIDYPFCLNWANENWSKLWDGGDREVRYKQELLPEDDEKFFADILPFFRDNRYITVRGKPLFLIYRPQLFSLERCRRFVQTLRAKALQHGFPGLYICSVNSHGFQEDPDLWGLDALVEFPPHCMLEHGLKGKSLNCFVNPNFDGHVWDGEDYVQQRRYLYETNYKTFKGVFPSWDNTPRKAYSNGSVIDGITPKIFKDWLCGCIEYTRRNHDTEERFIFINAWNEWAEGAHLEPDTRYGYAYLQAVRDALYQESI